jgi:hypothetical protein
MVHDGLAHWRWLTRWLLPWYSSLGHWRYSDNLGDVLHDGHMEMVAFLENTLLRRKSIFHSRGEHWALDNTGYLGCLHGGLELAWEHLDYNSVDAGGVDPVEYMAWED